MTKPKTVYVLGAGASFEFGLPVGDTLKEAISKLLSFEFMNYQRTAGDEIIFDALKEHIHLTGRQDLNKCVGAAREIARALPLALSIDNYLHIHNDDDHIKLCGKVAIVRSILSAESKSTIFFRADNESLNFGNLKQTWMIRLAQMMTEQCSLHELKDRLSTLTFIVFNYDRCLEHFLLNAFMTVYRISIEAAAEIVGSIAIYHPYGVVGNLPWMRNVVGVESIEFGGKPRGGKLLKLASEIKTFTEGIDDASSDFIDIRTSVQRASRFVFLGYAYHPLNMKLLLGEGPKNKKERTIYATAFGLSESDTRMVRDSLDNTLNAPSASVRNDLTCYKLFHEFSRTLGFN